MASQGNRLIDALSCLASVLTWLFVIGVPIGAGIAIRQTFHQWPAIVSWIVAAALFGLCFLFAEPLWRGVRWLVTGGKAGSQRPKVTTPEQRAAELLAAVLARSDIHYSYVVRRWPSSTPSPLLSEAYALLQACTDQADDTFDQHKLNQNLQRFNDIMNRLRQRSP
jgi:hypothetical protein